ncbi:flavodoxin [Sphingobium sufflavum]|nr:flavodoxin [Sphingobium sufflavum]
MLSLAGTACAREPEQPGIPSGKTLVAYLTRSGNTRVIAGIVQRVWGADLFEIRPPRPYPDDYEQHVAQATRERDSGFEPSLAAKVDNIAAFGTVFLGFPIWGETAPPPIRSFLKAHDLRGKTLRPFITHGGYGVGGSLAVLATHATGATIEDAFVMEADQERRTLNQVRDWLGQINS